MFGISFYEFLVIVCVALLLLRPKDIGLYLYNLGKIIKKAKNFIFNIQNQVEDIATLGNINDYEIKDKNKDTLIQQVSEEHTLSSKQENNQKK